MNTKEILLSLDIVIDNIYLNKYCDLIENSVCDTSKYFEKHHIIPKSYYKKMGIEIDNSEKNLVNLCFSNHILAHCYLYKCSKYDYFKQANLIAVIRMGGKDILLEDNELNESLLLELDVLRNEFSANPIYHQGMKGKHQSPFQKQRSREANSGENNHMKSEKCRLNKSHDMIGNRNTSGGAGMFFVSNSVGEEHRIREDELEHYLSIGYNLGKSKNYKNKMSDLFREKYSHGAYVNLNGCTKFVDEKCLNKYLENGYSIGKSSNNYSAERNLKVSASKKGKICITDGNKNKYIDPDEWEIYESQGFYKMSTQKYNKLYVNN